MKIGFQVCLAPFETLDVQVFSADFARTWGQACVIGVIEQSRGEPETPPIIPITQACHSPLYVNITAMGRPHSDLGLPTTKHERVLDLSTLSYKKNLIIEKQGKELISALITYKMVILQCIFIVEFIEKSFSRTGLAAKVRPVLNSKET